MRVAAPRRKPQQDEAAARAQARFRQAVDEELEAAVRSLLDACTGDKAAYGPCKRCKGRVQVDYPDFRGRTDAIKALFELGYGKPQAGEQSAGSFVVKRIIVAPDGVGDVPAA